MRGLRPDAVRGFLLRQGAGVVTNAKARNAEVKKAIGSSEFSKGIRQLLSALEQADARFSAVRVTIVVPPPPPSPSVEFVGTFFGQTEVSIEDGAW